ncbi:HRD ubiquitin ligase complex ER membrane protein [Encephalitozoon romaleae SJ-2008]|uniref:RING-type E3 ubiquitin transferase n=1 Tax=Encephalitozoon romaleae (strain SJ-2008) TaxID=1178016 RepID=I7AL70_ENCRO|nr:HRD ubiquitin ligase complex ER membrane protein [Encephalitozoon romaleae SJ-2008]AFN82399.1 HRD ubiquitin ligase complex ER membrane protein [Encephalitozoon romaleae SJ-2008]
MKKIVAYGVTHFILLAIYTTKASHGSLTMYNILTTTTRNSTVHILHATFLIFLMCTLTGRIIDHVFKSLRSEEISNFNESLLYFLTDFLLVVSTFDNDISFKNGLFFAMLLCVKSLSWLLGTRIKRDVYSSLYSLAYGISLFSGLMAFLFTLSCISSIDGQILFLFEYTLLVIASIKNICIMNLILSDDDDKRSLHNFYIDIAYMSITLLVYIVFIGITSFSYRLPLNLFRSALTILDALVAKIKVFLSYLKLCKDLEKCVEGSGDGFCAICRDDMEIGKKLACGHCFHIECLKMWCERQQTCPICKSTLAFDVRKESFVVGSEYISGIPVTIDS